MSHLLANGDGRSIVLFGGLGLWAVVAIVAINRRDGAWQKPEPQPRAAGSPVQAILFGEILLRSGKIDQGQLDRALALKAENGARMGEALVELGAITWADVSEAVHVQESLGGSSERGSDVTIVELD